MNTSSRTFIAKLRDLPLRYWIGIVIAIAVIVIGAHFLTRPAAAPALSPEVTHVHLASVASLSSATGPLPVTGKVASLSEATILAQSAGEIVELDHAIGDRVGAGEVIARFDNGSQAAAVTQAEGAYEAAQAALAKSSGGADASTASANAQAAAATALTSAYASLDDAIHTKADVLFSNPRSASPTLLLSIPDGQLAINIVNERIVLEGTLAAASSLAGATAVNVDANLSQMISDAQSTEVFLDDVIKALSEAQPNQSLSSTALATDQTSLAAARTEVVTSLSSLTAAKSTYDSGSGSANDIAAAQANVKQSLGALNAAKANLEKTIVRSPISGTIVSLPITQGGYVSSFAQVAVVSNPQALQVQAYVTPDDAKTLSVGGHATISGSVSGTIVSIAPALDPTTGKVLVKIGIGADSSLSDGGTVTVALDRTASPQKKTATASSTALMIPIVATKITPQGPVVFTVASLAADGVGQASTLVASPITLGAILGDQVAVTSGLTSDMDIVTDARGLTNGQTIVVDAQ